MHAVTVFVRAAALVSAFRQLRRRRTTVTLACFLLALSSGSALAASISVNTTSMTINAGTCTAAANNIAIGDLPGSDDVTSLPEAICAANGSAGADAIVLADAVYTISAPHNYWYGPTGLPPVYSDITIKGNGAIIERATTASEFRLFYVAGALHKVLLGGSVSPGSLTLRDLTLRYGLARGGSSDYGGGGAGLGGAIYNQGTLVLERVTASGNMAAGGRSNVTALAYGGGGLGGDADDDGGGGFRYDSVTDDGGGFLGGEGGLENANGGTSSIGGDGGDAQADCAGGGGGFAADATGCSGADGGADGSAAGFDAAGGGAFGGGGAGIYGSNSTGGSGGVGGGGGSPRGAGGFGGGGGFRGNGGFGGGGGADEGIGGFGGGDGPYSPNGGGGGAGFGGVIFNHFGNVTVRNSTLSGNTARGGETSGIGEGGSAFGGAIFNLNGTMTIHSSTLAGNILQPGAGGSAGNAAGGAVYQRFQDLGVGNSIIGTTAAATILTLENSILAGSVGGNDCALNSASGNTLVSLVGGNLIETSACGVAPFTGNPNLGALDYHAGLTETMLPATGSPAIDNGGLCAAASDQRGVPRPQAGACDIGAVEVYTTTYNLGVSVTGTGTVNASPDNVSTLAGSINDCTSTGSSCSAEYVQLQTVTLSASAPIPWHLDQWGGDCTGSNGNVSVSMNADKNCTAVFSIETHTIGGSVSGLTGSNNVELTLTDTTTSNTQVLSNGNGSFTFPSALVVGHTWNVTVSAQPPRQTCSIINGSGSVPQYDVTDIAVECVTNTYHVGGSVSGLRVNESVTLQLNGNQVLLASSNGAWEFPSPLTSGSSYLVTVAAHPGSQYCNVGNASGSGDDSDITDIAVTCTDVETDVDDGSGYARYGEMRDYQVTLYNQGGLFTASGVGISASFDASFDAPNAQWSCLAPPAGASCSVPGSSGFAATATVPPGMSVTIVVSVAVLAASTDSQATIIINIDGVASEIDTNTLVLFRDSFEVSDSSAVTALTRPGAALTGDGYLEISLPPANAPGIETLRSWQLTGRAIRLQRLTLNGLTYVRLLGQTADHTQRSTAWVPARMGTPLLLGSEPGLRKQRLILLEGADRSLTLPPPLR